MSYAAQVRRLSKDSRQEAEAFVSKRRHLTTGVSKTEIDAAIGKIANALWSLKLAQLKAAEIASGNKR